MNTRTGNRPKSPGKILPEKRKFVSLIPPGVLETDPDPDRGQNMTKTRVDSMISNEKMLLFGNELKTIRGLQNYPNKCVRYFSVAIFREISNHPFVINIKSGGGKYGRPPLRYSYLHFR